MFIEGIIWAVALYAVIQKIHQYPEMLEKMLSNVTNIALNAR
jgi:hypothetical protein